jgi:hypothetical protein
MPDRLYLSCRLGGFTGANMLRHFDQALRRFPFSRLKPGVTLTVFAVEMSEPAIFERAFPETPQMGDLVAAAREFRADDCAIEVEAAWDLWQFDGEWKLAPAPVRFTLYGPRFERDSDEHLRIEFGLENLFLPRPDLPDHLAMVRSNIRSLLHLVREMDANLAVERRRLWSESGENFAGRIQAALGA